MRRLTSGLAIAAMALAFVAVASTKADAALIAYICNDAVCSGGDDTIVLDNGTGDNFPGSLVTGQINAGAVNLGGMTIVSNVSQSKPLIGSATSPSMDIAYQATSTGAGEVWLYASDTDFFGLHAASIVNSGNFSGTGSISSSLWGGVDNFPELTPLICTTGTQTSSPFLGTCSGLFGGTGPYALVLGVHITRTAGGTTTGDSLLTVPEPASMAVFGLGMLGYGMVARRRRRA